MKLKQHQKTRERERVKEKKQGSMTIRREREREGGRERERDPPDDIDLPLHRLPHPTGSSAEEHHRRENPKEKCDDIYCDPRAKSIFERDISGTTGSGVRSPEARNSETPKGVLVAAWAGAERVCCGCTVRVPCAHEEFRA